MSGDARPPDPAQEIVPVCYRHPGRETWIRCGRCERPICPDCMVPASVGFQCPECVRAGRAGTRPARTVFGGRTVEDPGYVTKVLIALAVGTFLLQLTLPESFTRAMWLVALAQDPSRGGAVGGVAAGEWYRLLTVALLHGSLIHLGFNMYALWLFGPALEAALGRSRFAALVLVSALGGSAASYAFSRLEQPSVGASGAIFGLFAAYMVVGRRLGRDISALVVLLGINVALGFLVANVDWRAHAGGFITGGAVAAVVAYAPRARRGLVQTAGYAATALVLLTWVTVRTAEITGAAPDRVLRCAVTAPVTANTFLDCAVDRTTP